MIGAIKLPPGFVVLRRGGAVEEAANESVIDHLVFLGDADEQRNLDRRGGARPFPLHLVDLQQVGQLNLLERQFVGQARLEKPHRLGAGAHLGLGAEGDAASRQQVLEIAARLLPLRLVQPERRHDQAQTRQPLLAAPGIVNGDHAAHAVAQQHHRRIGIALVNQGHDGADVGAENVGRREFAARALGAAVPAQVRDEE